MSAKTKCELCNKECETQKAELRFYGASGWDVVVLEMCDKCIQSENANVVKTQAVKNKKKAA